MTSHSEHETTETVEELRDDNQRLHDRVSLLTDRLRAIRAVVEMDDEEGDR